MAPEMITEEPYDASIDIWSLGAAVWEMASDGTSLISANNAFPGNNETYKVIRVDVTRPHTHQFNRQSGQGAAVDANKTALFQRYEIITTESLEDNPNIAAEIQTDIDLCVGSNPQERTTAGQLLTDPLICMP